MARDSGGSAIRVTRVRFGEAEADIRRIREAVFVGEQRVPRALEWDGLDDDALHVIARDAQGRAVGTARLLTDGRVGRVGRMAVLREARGRGVGGALLDVLVEAARAGGLREVRLAAQTRAIGFYERFGFRARGDVFLDAGIPHREMTRSLA